MAYRQDWAQTIRRLAPKYNLDPQALLAVASREGLSGGVGDGGHAFGPFQLNDAGGVITNRPGNHRAFAESPEGIAWALSQIAQVAAGQHGKQAVNSIVRRFERPADPNSEVAGATGALGLFRGSNGSTPVTNVSAPPGRPVGTKSAPPAPPVGAVFGPQALALVNAIGGAALAKGGASFDLPQFVGQKPPPPAPKTSPTVRQKGPNVPATPAAAGLVGLAAKQLGQPYVWGGESRKEGGFDCSGLVDWAMRQQGYKGPRLTTSSIAHIGTSVRGQPLQPGDLVLANGGEHVVIYAGHGKVIAAPHTGTVVQYQPLGKFAITDVRRV